MQGPDELEVGRRNIMLGAAAAIAAKAAPPGNASAQAAGSNAPDTKRELTGKRALVTADGGYNA